MYILVSHAAADCSFGCLIQGDDCSFAGRLRRLLLWLPPSAAGCSFASRLRRPIAPLAAAFGGWLLLCQPPRAADCSFGSRRRRLVAPLPAASGGRLLLCSFELHTDLPEKNNNVGSITHRAHRGKARAAISGIWPVPWWVRQSPGSR